MREHLKWAAEVDRQEPSDMTDAGDTIATGRARSPSRARAVDRRSSH
jgi:hypothetical protein